MFKNRFSLLTVCFVLSLAVFSCGGDPKESKEYKDLKAELDKIKAQDSVANANIELYKKLAAVNDTTELPQLDALMATNLMYHDMPEGMPNGLQAYKDLLKMYLTSIPNMQIEIKHILAEGDLVMAHLGLAGVNSGASGDMPATGKSINVDGYDCIRIVDGKVVEYWSLANEMKMMTQMGLMPEMGEGE